MEENRYKPTAKRSAGGPPLSQYRLYFIAGTGRHITYSHEFEAESDERAIRISEAWREGRGAELWNGSRRVKAWEADG